MKSKQTNIDKILKDIKANNRRIKQGMPLKFIVAGYTPKKKSTAAKKALDTFMYLIACASISLMLVILLIQWMSI